MDILIAVIAISIVVSALKAQASRNQRERNRGEGYSGWGQQTVYPRGGRSRQPGGPAQNAGGSSRNAGGRPGGPSPFPAGETYTAQPVPEFKGTASDWDSQDRRPGEDELEALIRQNHAYEKELEKLLAVQEDSQ